MASLQHLPKPSASAPVGTAVPPSISPLAREIPVANTSTEELHTQRATAEHLGHHFKYTSPIAGVPPMQAKPQPPSPSPDQEEETLESPSLSQESTFSSGGSAQPGGTNPSASSNPFSARSMSDSTGLPALQARRERSEQLGHHFSQVSVLSAPNPSPQSQVTNFWVQRLCSQCQQEQEPDLGVQTQLTIGQPGDPYEVEADRVADQVMSMPHPGSQDQVQRQGEDLEPVHNQSLFGTIHQRLQGLGRGDTGIQPALESNLSASKSGGAPLPESVQTFMGPRLGVDLSGVRAHTDTTSIQMNRELGAQAFAHGNHIYYGSGKGPANDHLTAHELTHVVQQRAAPSIQHRAAQGDNGTWAQSSGVRLGLSDLRVQRVPGDGMTPPGDCSWSVYLPLRASVESAKAIVSTLGACSAGDNCMTLAAKIAAITAEIAARVALDTSCFRGGNTGHRQQVQNKINMVNRCYQFFSNSNCPQQLIEAMESVIQRAREVVAAAAQAVVTIAAVAALIAAIIVLVKVIIAAGATAAVAASAAAILLLLEQILEQLSPEEQTA